MLVSKKAIFFLTTLASASAFSVVPSSVRSTGTTAATVSSSSACFMAEEKKEEGEPAVSVSPAEGGIDDADQPKVRIVECPASEADMPFYALGVNLATQIQGASDLNKMLSDSEMEMVLKGFSEQIKGTSPQEIIPQILQNFGPTMNQILQERTTNLLSGIKEEGKEFIANFLKENGEKAIQTDSGLVYLETAAGDGASPTVQNTVEVHYHGTLMDGTVFDSSVQRGETISFPLGGVIKGWQEGLQLMKEGGKATIICPSDIAYGDAGSPPVIPPGATLKFEVELFKVS